MTFAASAVLSQQMDQVRQEALAFAKVIAAHIESVGPAGDAKLEAFVEKLDLPRGSSIVIANSRGEEQFNHLFFGRNEPVETMERTFQGVDVQGRNWTVSVGVPTVVAWGRARPNSTRTIYISGTATLIL